MNSNTHPGNGARPRLLPVPRLERAQREAEEKRKEAETAAGELERAAEGRKSRMRGREIAKASLDQHRTRLTSSMDEAVGAAALAGPDDVDQEATRSADIAPNKERLEAAIRRQSERAAHIRKLNERIASARTDLQKATAERAIRAAR